MIIEKIVAFITMFLIISPYLQSYKETIDNKELTYYSSYIFDEDTIIDQDDYISNSLNEINILVVKGAKINIVPGRNISKIVYSSSRNLLEEESEEDLSNSDNYKYGLTASIVAIGPGSQIIIDGATIIVDCPFSDAIIALNGARITIKNTLIITKKKFSKGLVVTYDSYVEIREGTSILTEGDFSPCIELKEKGKSDAASVSLSSTGEGSSLISTIGDIEINLYSSTGNSTNSQLLVMLGNSLVGFHNCDFTVNGKGINNTDYYKDDINLNNGGIIIYRKGIYNVDASDLFIFSSTLYIKNSEIPLISCFDAEANIIIDDPHFYFGKSFMRADMTKNSDLYTNVLINIKHYSFNETKEIIEVGKSTVNFKEQNMNEIFKIIKQD